MSEHRHPINYLVQLDLPAQNLSRLSFCKGSRLPHVEIWAESLRGTRIAHTSAQLYQNLPDINHLKTDAKSRLAMLEVLRPLVQSSIAGLAPEFVGQPLAGPAQKNAIVAQALQKNLINGYSLCVRDLLQQRSLNAADRRLLATAIARSLFAIGRLYLRACQIYAQMPADFWLQAHNLYQAAANLDLLATPVPDPLQQREISIRNHYVQPVTLACSRPNQLNPKDMETVYEQAENWAPSVGLNEDVEPDNENPFVINLSRDAAPIYKYLFDGSEDDHLLEPDFQTLCFNLQREGAAVPPYLIAHLTEAWGKPVRRLKQRRHIETAVDICLGLTSCHYHLAGKRHFREFSDTSGDGAESLEQLIRNAAPESRQQARTAVAPIRVSVLNISAGGYCLQWQGPMPDNAVAGQLLGICDAGQKEWHIGVARWVRQLRGASQMGVQVLGLEARPAAASIIHAMGGYSSPMRILRLAPDEDGNPATLVTAAIPFQEAGQIRLESDDGIATVRLERCLSSTSHMRRFTYHTMAAEENASITSRTPRGH